MSFHLNCFILLVHVSSWDSWKMTQKFKPLKYSSSKLTGKPASYICLFASKLYIKISDLCASWWYDADGSTVACQLWTTKTPNRFSECSIIPGWPMIRQTNAHIRSTHISHKPSSTHAELFLSRCFKWTQTTGKFLYKHMLPLLRH